MNTKTIEVETVRREYIAKALPRMCREYGLTVDELAAHLTLAPAKRRSSIQLAPATHTGPETRQ